MVRRMRNAALLLPALLTAGCALETQDVTYTGTSTPVAGTCAPPSRATLTIRHDAVLFAPSSGVLTLAGHASPAGAITAQATRPDMDHRPYALSLSATLVGERITGSYRTPACTYAVSLSRAS